MLDIFGKAGFAILMLAFGIGIIIYINRESKSSLPHNSYRGYILGIGLIIIGIINILKIFNLLAWKANYAKNLMKCVATTANSRFSQFHTCIKFTFALRMIF